MGGLEGGEGQAMTALAASALLALTAWLALALAMARHQRDLLGRTLAAPHARWLHLAGWLLLAASAVPLIQHWDTLTGLSIWGALISLPALVLVLAIAARARPAGSGRRGR